MDYECTLRKLTPQPIMSMRGRRTLPTLPTMVGEFLDTVWQYVAQQGGSVTGPPFTRYHAINGGEIEIEVGFPVSAALPGSGQISAGALPGCEAVVTLHRGPYDQLPAAGAALDVWAAQHGRVAAGPNWESYLTDPGEAANPADWETEVIKPLLPRDGE